MTANLFPMIFADARRSSFIEAPSSSKGTLVWESSINDDKSVPFNPNAILVGRNQLFLFSQNSIAGFNTDGKKLWTRQFRSGSPVSINEDKIYFRKKEAIDELMALSFSGAEVPGERYLLDASPTCGPVFIEPLEQDLQVMSICFTTREQGPPRTKFYRKRYDGKFYNWVAEFKGKPAIMPLHLAELNRFVVFSEEEIIVYNTETKEVQGEEIARFPYPVQEIMQCSADSAGTLYILGSADSIMTLVAAGLDGAEKWRWSGGSVSSAPTTGQPPIVGIEGLIHLPSGRTLITIKDGRVVREFTIEKRLISYCTALVDGSVLITAENSLYRADSSGTMIYGLLFDNIITAPPVVDQNGNVYVTSANMLMRIE